MIFDDTFEHRLGTGRTGYGWSFFAEIMRPMRFPANVLNAVMTWMIALSPFVLGVAGNYLRWEKRFEAFVNQGAASVSSNDLIQRDG